MKNNYVVLKLRTGETLFAEIIGHDESVMELINPFSVISGEGGSLSLSEWAPFTEESVYRIPHNICFYMSRLNKKFIKFYGSVILQSEINKIKDDVEETMEDRNDYHTMVEGVERMKNITKELSEKFSLDEDAVDFSTFDEKLGKHKPVMH